MSARPRVLAPLVLVSAGLVVAAGCAPSATYPKIEGSVAIDQPRLAPIPELMADAIEAAREEVATEGGGRLAFNLPAGTPAAVWNEVFRRVSGGVPATASDAAVAHVSQVRLRGTDAEVDVVIEPRDARPTNTPYLLTVTMKQEFLRDWRIVRTRAWRLPVDVPELAWVPPAEEQPAMAVPEAEVAPVREQPAFEWVPAAEPVGGSATAPAPSLDGVSG